MDSKSNENITLDTENITIDSESIGTEQQVECDPDLSVAPNELSNEVAELNSKFLRLAAEYDNYRKRTTKERENLVSESRQYAIMQLLPVLDNLERAAAQACTDESYLQGIIMITKQWIDILGKMNIKQLEPIGEAFDPNLHNAVMHVDDETVSENTIVEVFQKGYISGDKVIRPAMVRVAN